MTGGWFDGFWSVAAKELMHIRRDPASLVFALLIPTLQIILFGFAIDFDVRYVDTVVVDLDHSRESRTYIASLKNTQYLLVTARADNPEQAIALMRKGVVRVAVIIPPDFARRSTPHDSPSLEVLVDGSDSQVAARIVTAFHPPPSAPVPGVPDAHVDLLYNPEAKTARFTVPGLIGVILQLVTVSLTSLSLVREKEQGTLEQVMVSPVGRLGLMLGKIMPYAGLALVEMTLVLVLGYLVFDVEVAGSIPQLYFMTLPFLFAALAMGLVISTVAQNQGQAVQLTILTLLPSILLSGFVFPRESMPGPLYVLSGFIPVTYYVQILRGVIIRGADWTDLWFPTTVLWCIAIALITLAASRFRKNFA